jgi:ATP-dependent RNA helicase DDX27
MAIEDDEELDDGGAVKAAIRSAKKAARPAKIGVPDKRPSKSKGKAKKSGPKKVTARAGGAFDRDFGQKGESGGRREGVRAKKGDAIGGMGKSKGGKRKGKQ